MIVKKLVSKSFIKMNNLILWLIIGSVCDISQKIDMHLESHFKLIFFL